MSIEAIERRRLANLPYTQARKLAKAGKIDMQDWHRARDKEKEIRSSMEITPELVVKRSFQTMVWFLTGYPVPPPWCQMHPLDHYDGMGGCWGISHGFVRKRGEDYCRECEFYADT